MTVTSTLMSGAEVLVSWDGNSEVSQFFAPYADAFECDGECVVLPVTRKMVDTLISEVEDFLEGIHFNEGRWQNSLEDDDVVLFYKESLVA